MFTFISVNFSLMKTLVFWLNLCFSLSKLCNFLLFNRAFLQCLLFRKCRGFFYLFLSGFPILWHASTSFAKTLTSVPESTEITVSSKSLSQTCPEITETTYFLLPYCSSALTEDSLDTTLFSSLLQFSRNFLLLFDDNVFKVYYFFLRQFMIEIMFSSTLVLLLGSNL